MKTIAVFGSSRRDEDSPFWAEAYELGRVLATAGYAVLSGGYGGSMGAVSRGAAECGGQVDRRDVRDLRPRAVQRMADRRGQGADAASRASRP